MPRPSPDETDAERRRLAVLARTGLLDSSRDPVFDRIVRLAGAVAETETAFMALVAEDRQWFKAVQGRMPDHTPRDWSLCRLTILEDTLLEVRDARADPRFADSPLVAAPGGIRFYAGAPLRVADGRAGHQAIGTLCVTAPEPRALSRRQRGGLLDLAALLVREIETNHMAEIRADRAAAARAATIEVQHQMRNMFSRVGAIVEMTAREADSPQAVAERARRRIVALSQVSEITMRADFGAAPMAEVVGAALRPVRDRTGTEIPAEGPDLALTPAAASVLAPCIDELMHDALNRGALDRGAASAEGGARLRWSLEDDHLVLVWTEAAPVDPDGAFASAFLTRTAPDALRGAARVRPRGYELRVPLALAAARLPT